MDNTSLEELQNIVTMYKKDKITQYVVEKEIAKFMGDKSHVKISESKKNIVTKSFGVFILPEKLSDGFHMTYIIDPNALLNIYTEEEFSVIMSRLRDKKQNILKKFHEFINDGKENDTSYGIALGFILDLYAGYMHLLNISTKSAEYLPDDDAIRIYIDKFSVGKSTREDLEKLSIEEFVSAEILEFAKKYVKLAERSENDIVIRVVDNALDIPQYNYYYQHTKENCTSTFGIRDHKEIPYDYTPKTNQ